MGLFTNNKKPCPICGEGTPRLLATKIKENAPICSDCAKKVSLVDTQVRLLSVEGLKEHLVLREGNAAYLESTFRPNKEITIGWTTLNIDDANKVFTIPLNMCGDTDNPPVFKFEELIGYELLEEDCVIERFNKGDAAPLSTPMGYTPIIHINYNDKDEKPQTMSRGFKLNLYLSNPDWDKVESSAGSAHGNRYDFQREYNKHMGELRMVTAALAAIIGVAPTGAAGAVEQREAAGIAEDIKKFKELLDGGIITQEEFDAKKKQLLGI